MMKLAGEFCSLYDEERDAILARLADYSAVPTEKYFYEFCFCLCTPQSKARNAAWVQAQLEKIDYRNNPDVNIESILHDSAHYIRFHNVKAERIRLAIDYFDDVDKIILDRTTSPQDKRKSLLPLARGMGMKECSHFLRNIGFRGLGILDRHILRCLVKCGVFSEVPPVGSVKNYLEVEKKYLNFSRDIQIPVDELDLLFWSSFAGEILK